MLLLMYMYHHCSIVYYFCIIIVLNLVFNYLHVMAVCLQTVHQYNFYLLTLLLHHLPTLRCTVKQKKTLLVHVFYLNQVTTVNNAQNSTYCPVILVWLTKQGPGPNPNPITLTILIIVLT